MKKRLILLCAFFVFSLSAFGDDTKHTETITLSTYYPAPYGVYKDIRVTGRLAIGDVNQNDEMDNGDFTTEDESLTVAGKVGIGTATPQSPSPDGRTEGLLDVHDAYIRAANGGAGQWVSQIMRTSPVTGSYAGEGLGGLEFVEGLSQKITLGFRPTMVVITGIQADISDAWDTGSGYLFVKTNTVPGRWAFGCGKGGLLVKAISIEDDGFTVYHSKSISANWSRHNYHYAVW